MSEPVVPRESSSSVSNEVIRLRAKVAELEAHQITFEIEDKLMEAEFLRSQFDALGIVVETSVEEFGEGKKATTRTTINKRAEDLEAKVAEQAATDRNAKRSIIHALGMNSAALADWTWDQIAYRVGRQHQERSGLSHDKVTQAATIDELTQERERLTDKWSKLLDKSNKQAATIAELIRQRDMHACNAVSMMGQNEDKATTIEHLTGYKTAFDTAREQILHMVGPLEINEILTTMDEACEQAEMSKQEPASAKEGK